MLEFGVRPEWSVRPKNVVGCLVVVTNIVASTVQPTDHLFVANGGVADRPDKFTRLCWIMRVPDGQYLQTIQRQYPILKIISSVPLGCLSAQNHREGFTVVLEEIDRRVGAAFRSCDDR